MKVMLQPIDHQSMNKNVHVLSDWDQEHHNGSPVTSDDNHESNSFKAGKGLALNQLQLFPGYPSPDALNN